MKVILYENYGSPDVLKIKEIKKPVIDSIYLLSEAAEAIRCLEKGHARGKVIIKP